MRVDFFCPRWGSEHIAWDIFLKNVKDAGYKGIEWFPFGEKNAREEVLALLKKYELRFCIVMTVTGSLNDFDSYFLSLKKQLTLLCETGKNIETPLFISAQIGREYFTQAEVEKCISCCKKISRDSGIPVYHETHRNKWSYAVHVLPQVLKKDEDVLLTLDVSHWFCVSESYLEDQQDALALSISRTRHVHARVGHTQGSQVIHPALPQYKEALVAHLKIWDKWIEERRATGDEYCTITPEFGPPPYLIQTDNNISVWQQQWDTNLWMKNLLNKRYNF